MMNWKLKRRTFLIGGLLFVWPQFRVVSGNSAWADEPKYEFALIVGEKDASAIRKVDPSIKLGEEKKYVDESENGADPAFAPLVVMVAAVTLGYLAKVAFELWGNFKYSGLIVDLRKEPVQVIENDNLERGTLLVIDASGKTTLHKPENQTSLENILSKVLRK